MGGFYLQLLLLLRNVLHHQGFVQHCPVRTEDGGFPDATSEAGWALSLRLPLPATPGRTRDQEVSRAPCGIQFPNSGVHTQQSASTLEPLGPSEPPELTVEASLGISECWWTADVLSSPFSTQSAPTEERFVGEPPSDAAPSPPHSVCPSLPLTPASRSVTASLTHEAVDGVSRATRLTLRPHLKETSPRTGSRRADRTDSEGRPALSSRGHIIFTHEPLQPHHTVEPTFPALPSVSDPPQTGKRTDDLPPASRLEPTQSAPSSTRTPATPPLPDVSPTSYLTSGQLSTAQHGDTTQHLSPVSFGLSQDALSQQDGTTRGESSATSMGQLTPSGLTQAEVWLRTSMLESSAGTSTPALPSELFSGPLETPDTTNPVFSEEFVKESLLQTLSRSLPPDVDVSSLQEDPRSTFSAYFQTLISIVPLSASGDQWFEGLSVKSTVSQTEHIDVTSHIFLIPGMRTSLYPTALTTLTSGPTCTFPVLPSVSQSHSGPTAPSGAEEPNTAPTGHEEAAPDSRTSSSPVIHKLWTTSQMDSGVFSTQTSADDLSTSISLNLPPKVMQSIPVLVATVGFPFLFSIPPETFLDPEDGDELSLEMGLIDGPPPSTGTWLALDGAELRGVPLEVDLRFSPQHLLLVARDRRGLSASLRLTVDLLRSPVEPCHVFTLTARRSLHVVLRHRRMVDVLLRKLSGFFNSSGSHHLSVVAMAPGSTVVSWYNRSLCGTRRTEAAGCSVDRIHSMWVDMGSADGSVHPAFRAAMLPEFPVINVGPVSYRRDCFPSTPPPTLNPDANTSLSPTCVSAPPPSSQEPHAHPWMAGVFGALLVTCLLILIVLLVATILHFCKGNGRSRTVAIWPADHLLSLQSRDRRAIRPRRPPLLRPEPLPPPLKLWIDLAQDDQGPLPGRHRPTYDKALEPRPPYYDFSDT